MTTSLLKKYFQGFPSLDACPGSASSPVVAVEQTLRDYYNEIIPTIEKHEIEISKSTPRLNFWVGTRLGTSELAHSDFLAFLFSKSQNHCQRDEFLKFFLCSIDLDNDFIHSLVNDGYFVTLERPVGNLERVDIAIESSTAILWFEVKVNASISFNRQGESQLEAYTKYLEKEISRKNLDKKNGKLIFVSKSSSVHSLPQTIDITWKEIAQIVRRYEMIKIPDTFFGKILVMYSQFLEAEAI